jgi:hypothetical protein
MGTAAGVIMMTRALVAEFSCVTLWVSLGWELGRIFKAAFHLYFFGRKLEAEKCKEAAVGIEL